MLLVGARGAKERGGVQQASGREQGESEEGGSRLMLGRTGFAGTTVKRPVLSGKAGWCKKMLKIQVGLEMLLKTKGRKNAVRIDLEKSLKAKGLYSFRGFLLPSTPIS